ncbi:hypothetical protein IMX26_03475 [Clostridium sp. 'deep sea']|uniref:hypothetical protein n=1 Tax=Clostridium sp. 'deep sea' TaxID=2779445 RepID=UPI0018969E40|nr:hypothetical protein [Clostridium sp. 'deep sea']QOR35891.1 hypothetical protein IMX26_03475 [Clostridium sp. 'deep sea']
MFKKIISIVVAITIMVYFYLSSSGKINPEQSTSFINYAAIGFTALTLIAHVIDKKISKK